MDRREFIGAAAALTATAAFARSAPLPKRPYKNGIELSIIAIGGSWFVACPAGSLAPRRRSVRPGVHFDCAPSV